MATPGTHLGVLVEPRGGVVREWAGEDHTDSLAGVKLLDTSAAELRAELRAELGLRGPVVLTGHQVELSHAGVFAKSLALEVLREVAGSSVYLVVDSDTPGGTQVVVPRMDDGRPRRVGVEIPGIDPALAMESQPSRAVADWRAFFARVRELSPVADSLLDVYAAGALAGVEGDVSAADVLERGRVAVERELDVRPTCVVRVSDLSQTAAFRAFVAHWALHACRFAEQYNATQQAYRARHKVRNRQRPAPLLAIEGERCELPFWIVRTGERRRRLFVQQEGESLVFFAGDERLCVEDGRRFARVADVAGGLCFEQRGWHVRPRALTLSGFVRLLLSDLFVHGIGGAKYDEMTEDFMQRIFGVELPPMCCVSATMHLPLTRMAGAAEALRAVESKLRDVRYNPQRQLTDLPADLLARREELIRESDRLAREARNDRAARRTVFDELRSVNAALVETQADCVAELERERDVLRLRAVDDEVAASREYFYGLHSRANVAALAARLRTRLMA